MWIYWKDDDSVADQDYVLGHMSAKEEEIITEILDEMDYAVFEHGVTLITPNELDTKASKWRIPTMERSSSVL